MLIILHSFASIFDQTNPKSYPITNVCPGGQKALKRLCDLFALYHMENELGEFLEASIFTPEQSRNIHLEVEIMLEEIRPDAVGLVDAFNYSDRNLNSALGRYNNENHNNNNNNKGIN